MAEEYGSWPSGRDCPDVDGLWVGLFTPEGLPLLFPDLAWWDAWKRWAEASDRRDDAKRSGLG
jgi:hypothetical protein